MAALSSPTAASAPAPVTGPTAATVASNRASMPHIASVVDSLRRIFGPGCRVIYARENGRELGWVPTIGIEEGRP